MILPICGLLIPNCRAIAAWLSPPYRYISLIAAISSRVSLALPFFSPFFLLSGFVCEPCLAPVALRSGYKRDQCRSPLGNRSGCVCCPCRFPLACLPFLFLSARLPAFVSKNKCDGLQHGGLSHRWQTHRSSGIGPWVKSHATRWAFSFLISLKSPYPSRSRRASQIQQASLVDCATLVQKRTSGACLLMSVVYAMFTDEPRL
jgi:hypothetical protein